MEEDAQPLTEPIIPPITTKEFDFVEKKIPETNFDYDFMAGLMTKPQLIRNVWKIVKLGRFRWKPPSW
jgi:U5 small nuclear ribonucleoprotein component